MTSYRNAIISIQPKYADAIFTGAKTVELRRRIPILEKGTRLWIYATRPRAAIIGLVFVDEILRGSPATIWKRHKDEVFIGKDDFNDYYRGTDKAVAILLKGAVLCHCPVNIVKLREMKTGFHPPQVLVSISESESNSLSEFAFNSQQLDVQCVP